MRHETHLSWSCTLVTFGRRARETGLQASAPALKITVSRAMPAGVVVAKGQASIGLSTVISLDRCFSCGEMYVISELSMGSLSDAEAWGGELGEEGRGNSDAEGETFEKSWWKITATRRDAESAG